MEPLTSQAPRQGPDLTIKDLYPNLSEEKLREAEETLDRYIALVLKIYERVESDPKTYAHFKALTALGGTSRLEERSNVIKPL